MKIILLGAPGSGKGTLADMIKNNYGYAHVSTGDILRENIKNGTPLGKLAKPLIDAGNFVPDEIINEVVKNKLDELKDDYILDGYPRTINQAITLSNHTTIDKVVYINCPYDVILKRLTNRRTCSNSNCKAIYNLDTYSKSLCEKCGSPLFQREDDKEEVIKKRFEVYVNQTEPLIDFYKKQNNFVEITSIDSPEQTFNQFKKILKEKHD